MLATHSLWIVTPSLRSLRARPLAGLSTLWLAPFALLCAQIITVKENGQVVHIAARTLNIEGKRVSKQSSVASFLRRLFR